MKSNTYPTNSFSSYNQINETSTELPKASMSAAHREYLDFLARLNNGFALFTDYKKFLAETNNDGSINKSPIELNESEMVNITSPSHRRLLLQFVFFPFASYEEGRTNPATPYQAALLMALLTMTPGNSLVSPEVLALTGSESEWKKHCDAMVVLADRWEKEKVQAEAKHDPLALPDFNFYGIRQWVSQRGISYCKEPSISRKAQRQRKDR